MTKKSVKYFYSVKGEREFTIKVKKSLFICSLNYAETTGQAKEFISKISNEHKNATHNCWAYIVGDKGEISHCSDAGEPSGTAGKPMLNALKKNNTTNIAAVVTRHFGGIKLGIRGLINAYTESVMAALREQRLIKLVKTETFQITTSYSYNDTLLHQLEKFHGQVIKSNYLETVTCDFEVETEDCPRLEKYLSGARNSGCLTFIKQTNKKVGL